MKKLIIILGILLAIPMVSYTVVDREKLIYSKQISLPYGEFIQIRRIDGCEYIIIYSSHSEGGGAGITHEANCPNHK